MKHLTVVVAFAFFVAACSASGEFSFGTPTIENATEDLIEDEIGDQIGLGDLDAICTKPVPTMLARASSAPQRPRMEK